MLYYLIIAVSWLINLLCILIVIRSLISWLPLSEGNRFVSFLTLMTDPVVAPIRSLLSRLQFTREMPVDFSPMIAIIVLYLISNFLRALVM